MAAIRPVYGHLKGCVPPNDHRFIRHFLPVIPSKFCFSKDFPRSGNYFKGSFGVKRLKKAGLGPVKLKAYRQPFCGAGKQA